MWEMFAGCSSLTTLDVTGCSALRELNIAINSIKYGFIKGTIEYIKNNQVCIDTGNVGYLVNISEKTYNELFGETDEIKLYTYTSVKEDDISLYGFLTLEELDFYKLLISVNSIGPKLGMSVLSHFTISELVTYIVNKDAKAISKDYY